MKHIKSFKLFESYDDDLNFLNESKLFSNKILSI